MATTSEYIETVLETISRSGFARARKMFGEYMVYLNEKPIILVCDNTVYVKKVAEISDLMSCAECGIPYDGAKEHYILDLENTDLASEVLQILDRVTPLPKKKRKSI